LASNQLITFFGSLDLKTKQVRTLAGRHLPPSPHLQIFFEKETQKAFPFVSGEDDQRGDGPGHVAKFNGPGDISVILIWVNRFLLPFPRFEG